MLELLRREKVTVLNQTPTAFYPLCKKETEPGRPADLNLRYVIFGGEKLLPMKLADWKQKYPRTKLINMYGITETTVHVTYKEIGPEEIRTNATRSASRSRRCKYTYWMNISSRCRLVWKVKFTSAVRV